MLIELSWQVSWQDYVRGDLLHEVCSSWSDQRIVCHSVQQTVSAKPWTIADDFPRALMDLVVVSLSRGVHFVVCPSRHQSCGILTSILICNQDPLQTATQYHSGGLLLLSALWWHGPYPQEINVAC